MVSRCVEGTIHKQNNGVYLIKFNQIQVDDIFVIEVRPTDHFLNMILNLVFFLVHARE